MDKTPAQTAGKAMGGSQTAAAPMISVVTVVLNAAEHLARTISSVAEQTWEGIELIIIDGGSTDGTLDIIRRHDPKTVYWISEPDKGIYDAMNKGIDRATGEWIVFLNAGDMFADVGVLSDIVKNVPDDIDVLYGRHEEVYGDGYSRTPSLGDMRHLWKGMVFCHQSMLTRTSAMKRLKFNIDNRIAADYEFIFTLYAQQHRFRAVDRVISRVIADGFSASNNLTLIREQWRIAKHFSGRSIGLDCYYFGAMVSVSLKNFVKRWFPRRMVSFLRAR